MTPPRRFRQVLASPRFMPELEADFAQKDVSRLRRAVNDAERQLGAAWQRPHSALKVPRMASDGLGWPRMASDGLGWPSDGSGWSGWLLTAPDPLASSPDPLASSPDPLASSPPPLASPLR